MKTLFKITLVFFLTLVPFTAGAANVMLLGDNNSETQVQAALETAGHTVTFAGDYYDWNGVTPDVTNFDVVVYLSGYNYGYPLQPAALSALTSFVAGGCGLVTTEWLAYGEDPLAGYNLMPVTYGGDYSTDATWTISSPGHPLVAGLPASWTDYAGFSEVVAKPGTVVVVTGATGPYATPMLSYSNALGGTVVHINHDMTYENPMSTESLQIIVNAAEYASCGEEEPIPTLNEWGMIVFSLLMAGSAFWFIKKKSHEIC